MKKIVSMILMCVFSLSIISCHHDSEKKSLDAYITHITKNQFGYSDVEIDHPNYFLPNNTFLEDYSYLEGDFYWRESDCFKGLVTTDVRPEISFLWLKYTESNYYQAKECMLAEIEPHNQKFYAYGNYIFYENSNFISLKNGQNFPEHFTMACYNDERQTLIFMGLYSTTLAGPSCLEEKYLADIDDNWIEFIDTYYGEVYDFGK